MKSKLFLNADVGEGMQSDAELMPYLTYANIACGGHFGNSKSISETLQLAIQHGVKVGAHPSYPDKANFGRKSILISRELLFENVKNQIEFFLSECEKQGVKMNHIKLHGALYNDVFSTAEYTQWFCHWVQSNFPGILVFSPLKAIPFLLDAQKPFSVTEVFADRNYKQDLSLVERSNPKAVLKTVEEVKNQVNIIVSGKVITIEGEEKKIEAQTLCVHGDHPLVLEIAKVLSVMM